MRKYKSSVPTFRIVKEPTDIPKVKIASSKDAAEYARQFYFQDMEVYESVFLILLNRPMNTIGWFKVSQGGTCSAVVDIKMLAKVALDTLASGAILVHNHPSGNTNPSDNDRSITKKAKSALELIDCQLMDHIILTAESHFSFIDNGML